MTLSRRQFANLALSAAAISAFNIAPAAAADGRSGTFSGLNSHITTGKVTIEKKGGKTFVVLGDDFSFDGAPDPKLAFGKGGKYTPGTIIHPILEKKYYTGASKHEVPANINVDQFDEVYVWCEQFKVPLGVAKIK